MKKGKGLFREDGLLWKPWGKNVSAFPFRGMASTKVLWPQCASLSKTSSKRTTCLDTDEPEIK